MIFDEHDKKITMYMPNEIFDDLQTALKNPSHAAYAYSYYYLVCYMYRYCKYGTKITHEDIKRFLGYSAINKTIDYITKKGGILDQIGYTETTTDYPIRWEFDTTAMTLVFYTINDLKNMENHYLTHNDRNYKIKYPVKAFYRVETDERGEFKTGTFYDIRNTHGIEVETFKKAMELDGIGTDGFYLYAYLKVKNNMFPNGYHANEARLVQETKYSKSTIYKYLRRLEEYNFIAVDRKAYVIGLPPEDRFSNGYITKTANDILQVPKQVKTRKVRGYSENEKS